VVSATVPAVARTVAGCPKSRSIKGIDEDMKLNKALWEMAEVLRNGRAQ
jgi:hypothetical protein